MLRFKLYRKDNTADFCHGRLYVAVSDDCQPSDGFDPSLGECLVCDTIEPPVRPAAAFVRGKTAVPAGTYDLALTRSPKFGRPLPVLIDVPGMTGVRIHRGNTVADTRGCIIPGRYVGRGRVVDSTPRELDIVRMMMDDSEGAEIESVDDFAAPSVEDDRAPVFSSWPLASLVSRSVWDRLRLSAAA